MTFNPGLRTLIKFLRDVEARQPVNFSGLCRDGRRGYGMVGRYIRFCLEGELIQIVAIKRGRGRYPSKDYALSERGQKLLNLFPMKEDEAHTIRKRSLRGP